MITKKQWKQYVSAVNGALYQTYPRSPKVKVYIKGNLVEKIVGDKIMCELKGTSRVVFKHPESFDNSIGPLSLYRDTRIEMTLGELIKFRNQKC